MIRAIRSGSGCWGVGFSRACLNRYRSLCCLRHAYSYVVGHVPMPAVEVLW